MLRHLLFCLLLVTATTGFSQALTEWQVQSSQELAGVEGSATNLELRIITDCWPEENTWVLVDENGIEQHAGGPYYGVTLAEVNEAFWLESGTYTFTFYDAAGDGLYATQWGNACGANGSVELIDASGFHLINYDGTSNFDSLSVTFNFNSAVGIPEQTTRAKMVLFPNPVQSTLQLNVVGMESQTYDLSVFSATGKQVISRTNLTDLNTLQLDVSTLPAGLYHLSARGNNRSVSQTFVVQ